jgi:ATP-dependent DNA helicase
MVSLRSRKVIPASEMVSDGKTEKDASGDSPTSVLNEEENCEEKSVTVVEEEILLAKNGDSSLISEAMAQEEEQLLKLREDEEKANNAGSAVAPNLNETQFTKLDELLTQTQLYSEFLLEKMEDITIVIFFISFFFVVSHFSNGSHYS